MSNARGRNLQNQFAAWLKESWWPHAESAGAGRNGTDILGTPGVAWEVKTADLFRPLEFVRQAKKNAGTGDVPVVVYFPRGTGAASIGATLSILPTSWLMYLLEQAGYTPDKLAT